LTTNINILLKAVDQASGTIKGVAATADTSFNKVKDANNKVEKSSKEVALAFNNVATSGLALYNSIDRVQTAQVALDRANLAVKTTANAVEDAQRKYNATVEKSGIDSEAAAIAAGDLKLAQERYEVACSRAELAQGNVNQAMMSAAVTVIPSLITMITSVSTLTKGWTAVTEGISGAMSFLAANPIILVVAGIAALVAGLIWAYQNCEPFRNAVNAIANVLGGALSVAINSVYGALKWLWDSVLVPLGNFLSGTLLTAWNTLSNGISWAYNNILKPVFDALAWVWNNVIKPIADVIGAIVGAVTGFLGGGGTPSNQNPNVGGHLQHGGIVTRPTLTWVGEAGPEAVIPLSKGGLGNNITIHGPLITVQGTLDNRTADYAIAKMTDMLKNVLVEPSSVSGSSTHKRIRFGS
jgi:phage-related protein